MSVADRKNAANADFLSWVMVVIFDLTSVKALSAFCLILLSLAKAAAKSRLRTYNRSSPHEYSGSCVPGFSLSFSIRVFSASTDPVLIMASTV